MLRSNVTDWSAAELWRAYIPSTEAEAALRIQKDEMLLRPIWHQKTERVKAHILVCFLAYVLRKTLEGWCQRVGLGSSVPTLLEVLDRINSMDPTRPTRPETEDVASSGLTSSPAVLDCLGLELPHSLRRFRKLDPM